MASEHGRSRTGLVCPARSDVEPEAAEEVEAGDDHQRQCDDRDVPFVRKPSETPMMMRNGLQKDEEEQEEQEESSAAEPGSGGGEAGRRSSSRTASRPGGRHCRGPTASQASS